jgi:hypothetical protein
MMERWVPLASEAESADTLESNEALISKVCLARDFPIEETTKPAMARRTTATPTITPTHFKTFFMELHQFGFKVTTGRPGKSHNAEGVSDYTLSFPVSSKTA